jgi:hypothetical protein
LTVLFGINPVGLPALEGPLEGISNACFSLDGNAGLELVETTLCRVGGGLEAFDAIFGRVGGADATDVVEVTRCRTGGLDVVSGTSGFSSPEIL